MSAPHAPARWWFFDLDGTLIDSSAGILDSLRFALHGIGAPEPGEAVLRGWIGPPLRRSFGNYLGNADPQRIEAAVALYLQHMEASGWRRFHVYDGAAEMLQALADGGARLCVVTAKIESFARRILATQAFGALFSDIVGATADGRLALKTDLVAEALRRTGADPARTTMVGDRDLDMAGAVDHGLTGVGVLWGFGSADELRAAGATRLLARPSELLAG